MPTRIIRFSSGGKDYEMPWDKDYDPDAVDAKRFMWEQNEGKSGVKKAWDWANEPLSDLPSRAASSIMEPIRSYGDNHTGPLATAARVGGAFGQAVGDVGSSMTSPLSIGLMALPGVGAGARGVGATRVANAVATAERGAQAGMVAHGGYKTVTADTPEEAAGGLIEAGLGAFGLRSTRPRPGTIELGAEGEPRPIPSNRRLGVGEGPASGARGGPRAEGPIPDFRTTNEPFTEGDFRVVDEGQLGGSQMEPIGVAGSKRKALPPARPTYYGGPGGGAVGTELADVPEGAFRGGPGELAPTTFSSMRGQETPTVSRDTTPISPYGGPNGEPLPNRDILPQTSPYGRIFMSREDVEPPSASPQNRMGGPIPDMPEEAAPPPKTKAKRPPAAKGAEDTSKRPYAKASDKDVMFLASDGDAEAIREAGLRPSMRGMTFDEAGSAPAAASVSPAVEKPAAKPAVMPVPKSEMPSEARMGELTQKMGGKQPASPEIAAAEAKLKAANDAAIHEADHGDGTKLAALLDNIDVAEKELKAARTRRPVGGSTVSSFGAGQFTDIKNAFLNTVDDIKEAWGKPGGEENPYLPKFADWVNKIKASKLEGVLKGREFKDLDSQGFDAITRFQQGDRTGRLADVAKYFDDKFAELRAKGIKLDKFDNYLPQIWADDPKVVSDTYRRLGLKPSFTMKRIFEDYATGIQHGLTPRFKTIGELAGYYEQKANKAIADREFFDQGRKEGWIKPQGKGEAGWKKLDPEYFPATSSVSKDGTVKTISMTAPPEMHELIHNYLAEPNKILRGIADKASFAKNLAMSSGVPGTGINAHGFNIIARTVMGNPKEAWTAAKYILNPKSAGRYLDGALHTAPEGVRAGLSLTAEGHEMGVIGSTNLFKNAGNKFLEMQGKLFEDPLFQKMIPALKLKHWNDMTGSLEKTGMPRAQAARQAAEFTNNLYGGINWEAFGRSRDWQNVLRGFVLAPDWAESNINLGKGMVNALRDTNSPLGSKYAYVARNLMAAYIGANVLNYGSTGHFMWENGPGHALDVDFGQDSSGKKRWFRPFGTAADFARLPYDTVASLMNDNPDVGTAPNILKNRLSIPARVGVDWMFQRDRFGRPMGGRDDFGRPRTMGQQLGSNAAEFSSLFTPPYAKAVIDYGMGNNSGEQALSEGFEAPMRYSAPAKEGHQRRRARTRSR